MTKAKAPIGYQVGGASIMDPTYPFGSEVYYNPQNEVLRSLPPDWRTPEHLPIYAEDFPRGSAILGQYPQGGGSSYNLGFPMASYARPEDVPVPGGAYPEAPTPQIQKPSGIGSTLAGVGNIISGITGVGALIMNWWAANKQMKANKAAQAAAQAAYERQEAEGTRRWDITQQQQAQAQKFGQTMGLRQQAYTEKMGTAQLGMQKEAMRWDKMLQVMQSMMDHFSSPKTRYGLAQTYRR